uniref:EF-hand domain-containing protein n=2 Tax=Neobodo designis TaxID=312471 RepID=A0A7S1M651_NEODS|mmetsp:Transcript_34645/g.107015  ORF Transcript_34645/g.107015 Transcript_34645/m.107015 type:complete len:475 (+) Transcript_34645:162-1586(+)
MQQPPPSVAAVRLGESKGGATAALSMSMAPVSGGRRGTVYNFGKRRDKKRIPYLVVLAIARMRVRMRPRLDERERMHLFRLYAGAGVMRSVQHVMEVLSNAGIGGGYEEIEEFLVKRAWFKPGMVVKWQQFLMLAKYFKAKFVKAQEVSDSDVAFIALGGNEDLSGNVHADVLRKVWKDFKLTEDIEAFIAKHDEDKSGELEIDEFSALFREAKEEAAGDRGAKAPGSANPAAASVMRLDDDDDDIIAARRRREEEKEQERLQKQREREEAAKEAEKADANPMQVIEEVDRFIREQSGGRESHKDRRKSRAALNKSRSPDRKPLWEPTRPAEMPAKERLAIRAAAVQPGGTFPASRRFEFVDSVTAPPPPPSGQSKSPRNAASGSKSARLPPIAQSKKRSDDPNAPQPWYARNPFDTGNNAGGTETGTPGYASPHNGASTSRRHDARQYERQRLPVVVRNEKGQSVLVQPEMTF